jgi:hypothetical protein
MLQMFASDRAQEKIVVVQVKNITADEYAKMAPKEATQFVENIRKSQNRLVYMQVEAGGRKEPVVLIVRVKGGRAFVVGLGQAVNQ